MATTRKRRKRSASYRADTTLRHVWLASLGLLVAARREGSAALGCALARAGGAADGVRNATRRAGQQVGDRVDGLRDQVKPMVDKFGNEVEARLAPVFGTLGIEVLKAKGPARKPRKAPAKAARRATTRKPARRTVRLATR